jgi:hypothetical protein
MGTRVNVILMYGDTDNERVFLQANSSHPDVSFEKCMIEAAMLKGQPTAQLRLLLERVHPSDFGKHRTGEYVFHLGEPHPDPDMLIEIFPNHAQLTDSRVRDGSE